MRMIFNFARIAIASLAALLLAACGPKEQPVIILAAMQQEAQLIRQYIPEATCICTGVGASNVINALSSMPAGTRVVNIGYAGSNNLEIGSVVPVSESRRLMTRPLRSDDFRNPFILSEEGYPCYTSNSFVTQTDIEETALFEMELNYMVAFPLEFVGAIKIVSDNLSNDEFVNGALRESGILRDPELWQKVADMFHEMTRQQ